MCDFQNVEHAAFLFCEFHLLQFISPLLRTTSFHEFYCLRFVLVFVFLITFLFVDIISQMSAQVFKAWNLQFLVNFLCHIKGIGS